MRISEGKPFPLGATMDDKGANFALFSANATKVEVCLFDSGGKETGRYELRNIPTKSSMATSRALDPACFMDFACTVLTRP